MGYAPGQNKDQYDDKGRQKIVLHSTDKDFDVNYPLPTDGDSVYVKDIWVAQSLITNWVDVDDADIDIIKIPFTNLHTRILNSSADNPKIIRVHFNRTISAHQVGLGAAGGGNYSNVKVSLLGSGEVPRTVKDDSGNNTKRTSYNYEFEPQLFNALQLEFYTDDAVTLSNITIQKAMEVNSFIKIQKPLGEIVAAQGTAKGNFKMSLEEYDPAVNPIRTDLEGKGKRTVSNVTATEITFTGTTRNILITAHWANSGTLFVGKSDVTNDGSNSVTFLLPGETLELDYDDVTNGLYIISDTADQHYWSGTSL